MPPHHTICDRRTYPSLLLNKECLQWSDQNQSLAWQWGNPKYVIPPCIQRLTLVLPFSHPKTWPCIGPTIPPLEFPADLFRVSPFGCCKSRLTSVELVAPGRLTTLSSTDTCKGHLHFDPINGHRDWGQGSVSSISCWPRSEPVIIRTEQSGRIHASIEFRTEVGF